MNSCLSIVEPHAVYRYAMVLRQYVQIFSTNDSANRQSVYDLVLVFCTNISVSRRFPRYSPSRCGFPQETVFMIHLVCPSVSSSVCPVPDPNLTTTKKNSKNPKIGRKVVHFTFNSPTSFGINNQRSHKVSVTQCRKKLCNTKIQTGLPQCILRVVVALPG